MERMKMNGFYVVSLRTPRLMPIDIDPRRTSHCLMVKKGNVKFGITKDLDSREKTYHKIFGGYEKFEVIFSNQDYPRLISLEKQIKSKVERFRMVGSRSDRKHEWLEKISVTRLKKIIEECHDD